MARAKSITLGKLKVYPIWFDSMGAKASSVFIETPDTKILVDPGAAQMQPSYPLSSREKKRLRREALSQIKKFAKRADTIFISHYHYDHYTLPKEASSLYRAKKLWIKDPNHWINRSQWERARLFLTQLYETFEDKDAGKILQASRKIKIADPLKDLPVASRKKYGDYQKRKKELIRKGRKWFKNLVALWEKGPWVKPFVCGGREVCFVDGRSFKVGSTKIRFTRPLFHGIEYDRLGWVIGMVVEYGRKKVCYSSDLQGPMIEDYAKWIIKENPDILILDGPATYLFGYMLNRINLKRAVDNVCRILDRINPKVMIYDHHLLRDSRYRKRVAEVYKVAKNKERNLITAAEWLGQKPLIF